MALEGGHGLDDVLRASGIADAPAGHGVGLGDAVDDDGLGLHIVAQGGEADVVLAVVDQLLVDLVGDDVETGLHSQLCDLHQLAAGIDAAVGVGGAVEDDGLGLFVDVGAQHLGGDDEVVLLAAVHHHRHAAGHAHHLGVAQPAGGGQQHLVAGVDQRAQGGEDHLLCAVGDDDLGGIVGHAVVAEEFIADLCAQIHGSGHSRVARDARVDGEFARVVDVLRGAEVRLAGAKGDHVHALGAQLLGLCVDCQGNGGGDGQGAFRQRKRHKFQFLSANLEYTLFYSSKESAVLQILVNCVLNLNFFANKIANLKEKWPR